MLQADGIAPKDTPTAVQPEPSEVEVIAKSSGTLAARKQVLMVRMDQVKTSCCLMTCAHRRNFGRSKNWNLASARVAVLKEGESRSDASWYS